MIHRKLVLKEMDFSKTRTAFVDVKDVSAQGLLAMYLAKESLKGDKSRWSD